MKKRLWQDSLGKRLLSLALAVVMVFGVLPLNTRAEVTAEEYTTDPISTVADPQTIGRPGSVYGENTKNAGKVTVGKSVHNGEVEIGYGNGKTQKFTPGADNFIITTSQAAQVVGLASESAAPVDVVFVLDTSNSMEDEVRDLVTAANNAIKTLLQANPDNRVAVVAFSGTSGKGTSGGAAANVLSPLAHYDGEGETAHLTLQGGNMYGRGMQGNTQMNRDATSQGTNIHAGIIEGARQLMHATDLTVNGVTRIPFLVVMSDGEPSYAVDNPNWYDPASLTSQIGNLNQAAGIGFLPALTAAYYKGKITEKYFGSAANKDNRCFVYTMGLGLDALTSNTGKNLANITMNPANVPASNTFYETFESYWSSYQRVRDFTVRTDRYDEDETFTVTADSITATKNAVMGLSAAGASLGYTGGYKYNDAYFSASQASDLSNAFDDVIISIQQQAMAVPTRVEAAHGADFSGYVTFTDPIGEYMEVKQIFGVLADGNYYQGKSFAQNIQKWNSGATQEFKDHFLKVLKERCKVTGASLTDAKLQEIIAKAVASGNQAYYKSDADYDNSFVWWGKSYTAEGEEDVQIQILDFAEDDSIAYITDPNTKIPAGADYVCRSYYFYGEAGGTVVSPNHEYLHFVVRVQRSLKAPYQETVVISAPASLLSMEKVLITEKTNAQGRKTYTATVTEADPARVVYEVGLRSDINAFNVAEIVGKDTAAVTGDKKTYVQEGAANYDAATGTYHFYTNDWDRTQSESSHHRAMAHATFDSAADNTFYTYTENTPIYTKNGDTYTLYNGPAKPSGVYYYAREVYDWSASTETGDTHTAVKRTEYILADIPANTSAVQKGTDSWYITKGVYKASSLSSAVEDVPKNPNNTGSATIVVHPHRTEDAGNSHYTVLLGNNGKLSLKAADTKSVMINAAAGTAIRDDDGKVVMVGDKLTYTLKVINGGTTTADATVTDTIPVGTVYVDGSVSEGGSYDSATKKITWKIEDIPAGHFVEVSFTVQVTEDALTGDDDVVTIDNQAYVKLDNGFEYQTNPTNNPPEGKKVVDSNGAAFTGAVDIPDVLVYRIRWHNDSGNTATVKITDIIPTGTTYVENSASHNGVYDPATKTVTWTLENVEAGVSGVVSFRVNVNATAGATIENHAEIKIGNHNPRVTNETTVNVAKGDLVLSKTVTGYPDNAEPKTFTLTLAEAGLGMNGTYKLLKGSTEVAGGITFNKGIATVQIKAGETLTIQGITAGAIISVTEAAMSGFTPTYTAAGANSSAEGRVTIVEGATPVSVAVTNTYAPRAVQFRLEAKKKLDTNFDVDPTTFGFAAYHCDEAGVINNTKQPLSGEVTVSGAAKEANIVFASEIYQQTGSYYYLISEINGGVPGVQYTTAEYLVKVSVTDDGSGSLKANVTEIKKRDNANTGFGAVTGTDITFTNTYAPKETQLALAGTKILTGRGLKNNEFSFTVKNARGNTAASGYNTDTNDTDDLYNNIVFSPITYKAADMGGNDTATFVYTVTEDQGNAYGVTYSQEKYRITVTVTDNDGHLSAAVTKWELWNDTTDAYAEITENAKKNLTFNNVFTPDDVSLTFSGTKTLKDNNDNKLELADQQFAFIVEEEISDGVWRRVTAGNNTAVNTDKVYQIGFSPIYYDLTDLGGESSKTFTYRIRELIPNGPSKDPNMHYDAAVHTVTVTLSQDANGHLQLTGNVTETTEGAYTYTAVAAFNNILQPDHVDVPIVGNKTTKDSNDAEVNGPSFSFSVMDETNTHAVSGGSAAANGAISFTNLTYTQPGTYYYWIYESNHAGQEAHGIQYSAQRFLLKVVVTRDKNTKVWDYDTYYYAAGTVRDAADVANYENGTALAGANVTFANIYGASGYYNLTATKTLTGSLPLQVGDYQFKLERLDAEGNVISTLYAANSDSDGNNVADNIVFPSIIFGDTDFADRDNNTETPRTTEAYRYRVSEMVTNENRIPGVKYSEAEYYFTIQATDNGDGTIATEVVHYTDKDFATKKTGDTAITFANTYAPTSGAVAEFVAAKVLEGRDLREGEFRFDLYYVETKADGTEVLHLVDTAYNMARGSDGIFDDVYFIRQYPASTVPGTYNYVIKEAKGNQSTIVYDETTVGKITVVIGEDTANATLTSAVSYPAGRITFTNSYAPKETEYSLTGTKLMDKRAPKDNEFAFDILKVETGTQGEITTVIGSGHNTDTDNDGKYDEIKFTDLRFTPADMWDAVNGKYLTEKTFVFRFVEIAGTDDAITYSSEEYQLTVVVKDMEGVLTVTDPVWEKRADANAGFDTVDAGMELVFNNTYHPKDISLHLQATKELIGHDMIDGGFSFLVHDITDKDHPQLVATGGNKDATVGGNGKAVSDIVFSNIGYTSDMIPSGATSITFLYEIKEQETTHGGVKIHEDPYYAKVVLTLDTTTGELSAVAAYYTDKACTTSVEKPVFTNTYTPEPVQVEVYADKTLVNKKLEAGEFTFTLTGNGVNQSKTNDVNGRVVFDKLTFSAPGTYQYTLTESVTDAGNASNYTLDHSFRVIIKVEDDLRGNLVAAVDYHEIMADGQVDPDTHLGGAEFINWYTAPPVTVNLTEAINATKTVQTPADVTFGKAGFKFQVTDTTGKIIKGWSNGAELDMIGVSDADGKISFPSFYFPTAGEYHYWITEQPSGIEGMNHDPQVWEMHILVRYNEVSGALEVKAADVKTYLVGRSVDESNHPTFINSFEPTPITLTLTADKVLDGRVLKNREFQFQLVEFTGVSSSGNEFVLEGERIIAQSYNDANGKIQFHVTYTAEDIGAHAYAVREMIPENTNNGIDYDKGIKAMPTVTISYDTASHKLVAKVNDEPAANGAVVSSGETFFNEYTTQGATVQIKANKVMTANRVLKDKEFTFGLMDSEGKVVATAKNDAAGQIVFQMSYDKAGTYTYKMFEQPGDDPSLTYDNTRHEVVVTVTDDMNGKLHAEVTYKNDTIPTFVNEYRALSVTATITAKKTLIGNKTLAAGDFTFELEREDGVKVTAKNATNGVVVFGMRYDAVGVYTYTLRELPGDADGVTYDGAEYKVIVAVTDDFQGNLNAVVTYEGLATGESIPTFVNTYKGKAAPVQITAMKTLSGKTLSAEAFTFTLTNKDNSKDVYTSKNDAKGNVVFDLNLTEAGTYTYILAEAAGKDANTTYDKTTCTVTVKVTDDLKGMLSAEVTYDTADGKAPIFRNVYTPSAVTVELTGEKKLSGRTMKDEEFKFEVRDSEGNVVATARNDAEGKLVFSAITLKTAGKYVFTVTEVKGSIKGMIYDTTAHEVTVEVVNDNGQLKTTVTEPEGGLVFKNTYKDPDPSNPGTGDDVPLFLLIGAMVISGSAVVVLLISRKKKNH